MNERSLACHALAATMALVAGTMLPPGLACAQPFTPVTFPDIAAHVGYDSGVSWVDFDGDGDLDLSVVTTSPISRPNLLYRNDGGTFVRVTGVAPVMDDAETNSQAWADIDGDGDLDLFLSNFVNRGNQFIRNLGGGNFAFEGTLPFIADSLRGRGCDWGDYDGDGWLDLIVAAPVGFGGITTSNLLFRNLGGTAFARVDTGAVVTSTGSYSTPSWCDWDGDGDLDLAIASDPGGVAGRDHFYRNQLAETGTAWFTPWSAGTLTDETRRAQLIRWIDYDNDGDFDVFITNRGNRTNELFRNDGGTFVKIASVAIVTDSGESMGCAWGDFDNDGDLDLYVARDANQKNRYYRNDGASGFTSITTGAFTLDSSSDWGVAAGDFDRDGDLDLFVTSMNTGPSMLYRNDLPLGVHWLELRLIGGHPNRSAIGARVVASAVIGGVRVRQTRAISTQTSIGGHDALDVHFGFGDASIVDTLTIAWPNGRIDRWTGLATDTLRTLVEGSGTVGVETRPVSPGDLTGVHVVPNPARVAPSLRWGQGHESEVCWELLDLAGRVWSCGRGRFGPGEHAIRLSMPARSAPSGVYFAVLRTPREASVHRVAILN